jgi:hypothetical protein
MSVSDIRGELLTAAAEPLLPSERTLAGWTLGIGLALVVILVLVKNYFPAPF